MGNPKVCGVCGTPRTQFWKCITCNAIYCPICVERHNKHQTMSLN